MSASPARIAPEIAKRALELPKCKPCDIHPLIVTDTHGSSYVHCPSCLTRTNKSETRTAPFRQWTVLAATYEP